MALATQNLALKPSVPNLALNTSLVSPITHKVKVLWKEPIRPLKPCSLNLAIPPLPYSLHLPLIIASHMPSSFSIFSHLTVGATLQLIDFGMPTPRRLMPQ